MRALDRFLQRWRVRKALPCIRDSDRLLDIGCYDPTLLTLVSHRVKRAVGIDPLAEPYQKGNIEIYRGTIPGECRFDDGQFDCITMLAVLEHIRDREALSRECYRLLSPGGRLIITVPRVVVDHILWVLLKLRLIHGMSLDEHHKYDIGQTPDLFGRTGFQLIKKRPFQLGLNYLFVFEKPGTA